MLISAFKKTATQSWFIRSFCSSYCQLWSRSVHKSEVDFLGSDDEEDDYSDSKNSINWKAKKRALKNELSAWLPKKRLAREEMDQIRLLAADNPRYWNKKILASTFKISYSAVGRILKSRFEPSSKIARRQNTIAESLKIQRQTGWRRKLPASDKIDSNNPDAKRSDGDLDRYKSNTTIPWQTQLLEFHNKRKFRDDMVDSSLFNSNEIIDSRDHINSPPKAGRSKYPIHKASKKLNQKEYQRKQNLKYGAYSDVNNVNNIKAQDNFTENKKFDDYRKNKIFKDSKKKLNSNKSNANNDIKEKPNQDAINQFGKNIDKFKQTDNDNLLNIDGKDRNILAGVKNSSAEKQDKYLNVQKMAKSHSEKEKDADGKGKVTFNEQEFNHLVTLLSKKKK